MSYTIHSDKNLKIIKHKLIGDLDESNLGKAWEKIVQMEEFRKFGYNVLSDYREAKFKFTIKETDILDDIISNYKTLLDGKKGAVIVNVPLYTAISVLISEKFRNVPNYKVKIFSTEEAAIEWLTK